MILITYKYYCVLTYLSDDGLKSLIRFITYFAAHSPTLSHVSKITNFIFYVVLL